MSTIAIQKRALSSASILPRAVDIAIRAPCKLHSNSKSTTFTLTTRRAVRPGLVPQVAQFRLASSTTTTSAPSSSTQPLLDWPTFFRLRTSRRRFSLVASILASLSTFSGAVVTITSTSLSDTLTSISPIPDPFVTLGVFTFFTAGAGWLIGPFFGQSLWRLMYKVQVPGFMAREKDFYERVKRYRVDPRGASAQNPVPDYYGEKVGSREDWRTWLKDQRAFNRKREGKSPGLGGGLGYRGRGLSE